MVSPMQASDAAAIHQAFRAHTLPKVEWTHHAHLVVCWVTLQTLDEQSALNELRSAIRSYNEATGTVNSDSSGYHETLTRYYVAAVASRAADGLDAVLTADVCDRSGPGAYWSRDLLFSSDARLGWVEPDLEPLPWTSNDRHAAVDTPVTVDPR